MSDKAIAGMSEEELMAALKEREFLAKHLTREAEKAMRSAGLLFLGSYDHFDDCYDSVLQTALRPQKVNKHHPQQTSNKTP